MLLHTRNTHTVYQPSVSEYIWFSYFRSDRLYTYNEQGLLLTGPLVPVFYSSPGIYESCDVDTCPGLSQTRSCYSRDVSVAVAVHYR